MTEGPPDDLLGGLVAGDERAYAALYDRLAPALLGTALAIVRSREEAEDAVQDVFLALVRAGDGLRSVRNLRAYVFAAVRRAAIRRRANLPRGRGDAALADSRATDDAPPVADAAVRLERAIVHLPDEQREVVALHVEGGLTFAGCAEVLGVSANTAASRYRYAIEKLRDALKDAPRDAS